MAGGLGQVLNGCFWLAVRELSGLKIIRLFVKDSLFVMQKRSLCGARLLLGLMLAGNIFEPFNF